MAVDHSLVELGDIEGKAEEVGNSLGDSEHPILRIQERKTLK